MIRSWLGGAAASLRGRIGSRDGLLACALAVLVAGQSLVGSALVHPVVYQYRAGQLNTENVWFDADIPKLGCLMTSRSTELHRVTTEHPLVSAASYLPTSLVRLAVADRLTAVRLVVAATGAVWIATLFTLLRRLGCRPPDAVLFALLAAVSASGVFWLAVPEVFLPGSVTIMVPLVLAAREAGRQGLSRWRHTVASAVSLSLTVTNWMSGLLVTFTRTRFAEALQISANAFVVVSILWLAQLSWFPASEFFLGSRRTLQHVEAPDVARAGQTGAVFAFHAIVMPSVAVVPDAEGWSRLSVQLSRPASGGSWGLAATGLWVAVLGLGVWTHAFGPAARRLRLLVFSLLGGQTALHLVFGGEGFLYTMHVLPLLVVLAACGTLGRRRRVSIALTAVLVLTAGVNNYRQFSRATGFLAELGNRAAADGAGFTVGEVCD